MSAFASLCGLTPAVNPTPPPPLVARRTISVTHGEGVALTTEDLSGAVSAGDRLRIGLRCVASVVFWCFGGRRSLTWCVQWGASEVVAKEPINRNGVTMQDAWGGTTARGLRVSGVCFCVRLFQRTVWELMPSPHAAVADV